MSYHLCVKTEPAQEKQKTTSEPQMAELYICMTNCVHKPAYNFATCVECTTPFACALHVLRCTHTRLLQRSLIFSTLTTTKPEKIVIYNSSLMKCSHNNLHCSSMKIHLGFQKPQQSLKTKQHTVPLLRSNCGKVMMMMMTIQEYWAMYNTITPATGPIKSKKPRTPVTDWLAMW